MKPIEFLTTGMVVALWAFVASGCGSKKNSYNVEENCISLHEVYTTEVGSAGVRTVFQALGCDGYPITDLADSQVTVLLDGEPIGAEGGRAPVLTQDVAFEQYALLLLDMSDSIVNTKGLGPMLSSARALAQQLVAQGVSVALYRFAGPDYFAEIQGFTLNGEALSTALDLLGTSDGLGTTDLYGSIPRAIDVLEGTGSAGVLTMRSLMVFTDGTDEAMVGTLENAKMSVDATSAEVFAVGLGDGVDQEELVSLGKSGFHFAKDTTALDAAFQQVSRQIKDLTLSYYLVAVCSPRAGGTREMTIAVTRNNQKGSLTVDYDATGFDIVGCNPSLVAFPCGTQQCGTVEGFLCGTCPGTEYCTDAFVCEEACTADIQCGVVNGVDCGGCAAFGPQFLCDGHRCVDPCANVQCGMVLGTDCGDCSELGATFGCDAAHTCVDACADAECGIVNGVDCGDCSERGAGFGCDAILTCVDACAGAECGIILGVNCGDCAHMGESFGCDAAHTCVDACAGAECGIVNGVDCGNCSAHGPDFGCDQTHTCVEACASAECGTVMGVSCGDCSERGAGFVCDSNNSCVDPCAGVECGTVMGVSCGTCEPGFQCTSQGICQPGALEGVDWVQIPGGTYYQGCTTALDPDCKTDEQPRRQVELTSYWMMSTEVTLWMYQACVDAGRCSASQLGTGAGCNSLSSGAPDLPVNCIDSPTLEQFCAFVGGTLPTEAQWERAYRGDHDGDNEVGDAEDYWIYPWGDSPEPDCSLVVMDVGGMGCGTGGPMTAGGMPATSYGLLNMAGNVAEWTRDHYGETYSPCTTGPCVNPIGPSVGDERVIRGGSYNDFTDSRFRTANRDKDAPSQKLAYVGGRCVL